MKTSYGPWRCVLWLICLYHVVVGTACFLPVENVQAAAGTILGLTLPDEPALYQVIKSFGVYALAFGVMMGVAAWNPVKNRALISIGVVLFTLRVAQRAFNLEEMQAGLGVDASRNIGTLVVVAILGGVLTWFRWVILRDMRRQSSER